MRHKFNVGSRLRSLRQSKGLTQEEASLRSGITSTFFGEIERNEKGTTVSTLEKICQAFDITLDQFFTNDNNDTNKELDEISAQILYQLHGRSPAEKREILNLIKLVFKIKNLDN